MTNLQIVMIIGVAFFMGGAVALLGWGGGDGRKAHRQDNDPTYWGL